MTAQQLLDRVQSMASIDALAADAGAFAAAIASELPDGFTGEAIEVRDAALATALTRIDELSARVMRIRLDHALASDTAIPAPTRKVFASTIVGYAERVSLLAERVRDVATRARSPQPDVLVDQVLEAAQATFALRDALREHVLALVRELARRAAPDVDRRARDRTRDDAARTRDSALRRELEAVAADPVRVGSAPLAARLAAWPDQIDDPAPEAEVTFADMIEMD